MAPQSEYGLLPKSVGWIGLGLMGLPMAMNLVRKMDPQTQFHVFDVVKEGVEKVVQQDSSRVHACTSSREVAERSDILFSMVPEGSNVRSVYLSETDGVLTATNLQDKLLVDCSTIDTATSLAVLHACQSHAQHPAFYDAPVSGGVLGAEKASLTFMLGCAASSPHMSLLRSTLSLMGANIFPCGGNSLGLTAKLCNNYCSGLIAIAVSEAMSIGVESGMDPRVLANVFHTSTAQSAICDDWCPVPGICPAAPASKGYEGGFRVGLMRKDFGLAVDSAKRVGVRLALGNEGLAVYEGAERDERCAGKDSRVVYRYLGGKEDWKEHSSFAQDEVDMARDRTRRWIELGKQKEKEMLEAQRDGR